MANDSKFGLQAGVFTRDIGPRPRGGRHPRIRRRPDQRGADLPRRPDALRRRQGLRQHPRGPGLLGDRADRGALRHLPGLAAGRSIAVPQSDEKGRSMSGTARSRIVGASLWQRSSRPAGARAARSGPRAATVVNGNFEAGNLSGWVSVEPPESDGMVRVLAAPAAPISVKRKWKLDPRTVIARLRGSFGAISDRERPGTHILYQDVALEPRMTHSALAARLLPVGRTDHGSESRLAQRRRLLKTSSTGST